MENAITLKLQLPQSDGSAKSFSLRLGAMSQATPFQSVRPRKLFVLPVYAGDFAAFRHLLKRVKMINNKYRWIFGDGHLVVFGDRMAGRTPVSEYLWFLYSLDQQARLAGGRLHYIPGIGDFSALGGHWRFDHPSYAGNMGGNAAVNALYDGNNTLWHWLYSRNIVEKVGRILLIQGGILPQFGNLELSLATINQYARLFYSGTLPPAALPDWDHLFSGNYNPLTYNGFWNGEVSEEQLKDIRKKYGVDLIVTHLPNVSQESPLLKHLVNLPYNDLAEGSLEGLIIRPKHLRIYTIGLEGSRRQLR
jgi:hypothetical protein